MTERTCPYCHGALVGLYSDVPDWRFGTGSAADVYRCADCGALAGGRVPGPDELASWYDGYYTHAVETAPSRAWSLLWPMPRRKREIEQLRWYMTPPSPAGRFLDVGTGTGERLVQFADAGWVSVGQDLDPEAGKVARSRGLEVHCSPVGELVGREEPFDLIGLSHVLEHAIDPAELLGWCTALLRPGGRLCIIGPNPNGLGRLLFGRWWFGLEQPRHLAIPTLASLDRMATRLGLQVLYARSVATNGTVILGGSLARGLTEHLRPGPLRDKARVGCAFVAQTMSRAAIHVDSGLGEELVWLGRRREA